MDEGTSDPETGGPEEAPEDRAVADAGEAAEVELELQLERFGSSSYAQLHARAADAHTRPEEGRVLLLPGYLATSLGRRGRVFDDVVWFDPKDVLRGQLTQLSMDAGAEEYEPFSVALPKDLQESLTVERGEGRAEFFPFDWRLDLETLGGQLADRLAEIDGPVDLVVHSLGGLVARAALRQGAEDVRRVICLGVGQRGAPATVALLRGNAPWLHRLASLDPFHGAEELAFRVFGSFPSTYALLPCSGLTGGVDLFAMDSWPSDRRRPRPALLEGAAVQDDLLAPIDDRFVAVAGVGQPTMTAVWREGDGFVYRIDTDGDGTVPRSSAELPGRPNYYAPVVHARLPMDDAVMDGVQDLLEGREPGGLLSEPPEPEVLHERIHEEDLERYAFDGKTVDELGLLERLRWMRAFLFPE